MDTDSRRRALAVALVVGVWTVEGLLWTGQSVLAAELDGRDLPLTGALVMNMGVACVWALLTPLILRLGRRLRIDREHWPSRIALHIAVSVGLSLPLNVVKVLFARLAGRSPALSGSLLDRSLLNFISWFDFDVLIYWAVLAVGYAIEHVRRVRERELRASQLEAQLAEARLRALEMQLHPHFLFNALHTIAALVRTSQNALAVRVVAGLGDLLRRALDREGGPEVSLEQELEFVASYLEIERIRFGDRLQVRLEVEPGTLDARVPYLVLQPLVENAIRHGIAPQTGAELVEIRARRADGLLCLEVRDDGVGLPPAWERTEGVGLRNTRARLDQLYGAQAHFEITAGDEGGTRARITLPFRLAVGEMRGEA